MVGPDLLNYRVTWEVTIPPLSTRREEPMKPLPITVKELIEELDKFYPNQYPSLEMSDREVWFNAGRRDVVNTLLKRMELTEQIMR